MTTFNKMQVEITVLSIDKANYKAKVKVGLGYKENGKIEERVIDCFIEGLAIYRFETSKKFELGKTYRSCNDSKSYEDNPLKVIRGFNSKTKGVSFSLKVVSSGKSTPVKYVTPNGNLVNSVQFKNLPKDKWMRYSDYFHLQKKAYEKRTATQTA